MLRIYWNLLVEKSQRIFQNLIFLFSVRICTFWRFFSLLSSPPWFIIINFTIVIVLFITILFVILILRPIFIFYFFNVYVYFHVYFYFYSLSGTTNDALEWESHKSMINVGNKPGTEKVWMCCIYSKLFSYDFKIPTYFSWFDSIFEIVSRLMSHLPLPLVLLHFLSHFMNHFSTPF